MIKDISRNILSFVLVGTLITPSLAWAQQPEPTIELEDLALPTEIKGMNRQSGAVYYSATTKNKTLMPVHFWGEVSRPGLHFIPVDTKLIKGLSFAGGGNSNAKLDEVYVNRMFGKKVSRMEFDLGSGGDTKSHEFTLQPGDTVFIEKDRFVENRAFYVSLVTVAATILSSIFIIKRIETMDR